jgi:hypothetical protein
MEGIYIMKQFELTRGMLLNFLKSLDEQTADVQPKGFNNTIHWHIGHVLVSAESFMFGYPKLSSNLPAAYNELFKMGSKPSDWEGTVPTVDELIHKLEDQASRIKSLPEEFFAKSLPLKFPFGNIETFSDLFAFMLYHEADHLGQMKAMKRITLK